jgi:hypothetical protein
MDFLLNKRINIGNNVCARIVSNDSTDTVRHDSLFGLDDSGIATSHDAHSLEFDDQLLPATPPPTIVLHDQRVVNVVKKHEKIHGTLEKSKATSSIPSLSINSNATINIHYYPEGLILWSYVIVFISTIVQILIHGLQLSFGVFLITAKVFFVPQQQMDLMSYGKLLTLFVHMKNIFA